MALKLRAIKLGIIFTDDLKSHITLWTFQTPALTPNFFLITWRREIWIWRGWGPINFRRGTERHEKAFVKKKIVKRGGEMTHAVTHSATIFRRFGSSTSRTVQFAESVLARRKKKKLIKTHLDKWFTRPVIKRPGTPFSRFGHEKINKRWLDVWTSLVTRSYRLTIVLEIITLKSCPLYHELYILNFILWTLYNERYLSWNLYHGLIILNFVSWTHTHERHIMNVILMNFISWTLYSRTLYHELHNFIPWTLYSISWTLYHVLDIMNLISWTPYHELHIMNSISLTLYHELDITNFI